MAFAAFAMTSMALVAVRIIADFQSRWGKSPRQFYCDKINDRAHLCPQFLLCQFLNDKT